MTSKRSYSSECRRKDFTFIARQYRKLSSSQIPEVSGLQILPVQGEHYWFYLDGFYREPEIILVKARQRRDQVEAIPIQGFGGPCTQNNLSLGDIRDGTATPNCFSKLLSEGLRKLTATLHFLSHHSQRKVSHFTHNQRRLVHLHYRFSNSKPPLDERLSFVSF